MSGTQTNQTIPNLKSQDVQMVTEVVGGQRVTYLKLTIRNPKEFKAVGSVTVEVLPAKGKIESRSSLTYSDT